MMVMHHGVHVAADHLLCRPAEDLLGGGIDEGGAAFRIHPIDAFAHRPQNEPVLALDVREQPVGPLPFRKTFVHEGLGPRFKITPVAGVEIAEGEQEQPALGGGHERAGTLYVQLPAVGVPGLERAGPETAPFQHRLREDDERPGLLWVQVEHSHPLQCEAPVAQQPTGGGIGVPDARGLQIDHQRRFGAVQEGRAERRGRRCCLRQLRGERCGLRERHYEFSPVGSEIS